MTEFKKTLGENLTFYEGVDRLVVAEKELLQKAVDAGLEEIYDLDPVIPGATVLILASGVRLVLQYDITRDVMWAQAQLRAGNPE